MLTISPSVPFHNNTDASLETSGTSKIKFRRNDVEVAFTGIMIP